MFEGAGRVQNGISPVLLAGSSRHCVRCPGSLLVSQLAAIKRPGRGGLDVGRRRLRWGRGCGGRGLRGSWAVLHADFLRLGSQRGSLVSQCCYTFFVGERCWRCGNDHFLAVVRGRVRRAALMVRCGGCGQRERQEARGTLCGRGCLHQLDESE